MERVDDEQWWRWVGAITIVGFVIRVAFIWFAARGDGPVGDQLFYSAQAIANARGDWFEQPFEQGMPAADHPPVTALLLTPVTWMFEWTGSVVTIQRLFMAVVGAVSIVVMAMMGRHIGGRRVGVIAAGLTAVYVNVWINDGLIMAETPTFLIVALLTFTVLRAVESWNRRQFVLIGGLVGLAALTRPELIALAPLITMMFLVLARKNGRRIVRHVGVLLATTGVVLAPWVSWNQIRFDGPVFVSTNDGLTLAGGNCDSTYFDDVGGWDIWCAYETDIPAGYDASQASLLMRRDALEYWGDHLDRYPVVAAARLARVFSVGFLDSSARAAQAEGRPMALSTLAAVQYWAMLPIAVVGYRRRVSAVQRSVLLGTLPIVIVVAALANAYVRFRVPAEVGLVVLVSLGFDSLMTKSMVRESMMRGSTVKKSTAARLRRLIRPRQRISL